MKFCGEDIVEQTLANSTDNKNEGCAIEEDSAAIATYNSCYESDTNSEDADEAGDDMDLEVGSDETTCMYMYSRQPQTIERRRQNRPQHVHRYHGRWCLY